VHRVTTSIGIARRAAHSAPVVRSPKAQKLCRAAHSTHRQWMIQDAQLRQHRRLIPVSMLVRDFAAIELDENGDE
jgi:hypothetical protein